MADPDIDYEQVAAAARALADAGQAVTLASLRTALGAAAPLTIVQQHLATWRTAQAQAAAGELDAIALPASISTALTGWARQLAEDEAARLRAAHAPAQQDLAALAQLLAQAEAEREQALARLAEREAAIERLTLELRHARDIASEALVGKAKDQLAIQGKDAQLAELRSQLERQVARSAAESDARLAAEMELVGAITARDNFAAELTALRAQQDAGRAV